MDFDEDFMVISRECNGFDGPYPLVNVYTAIEIAIEIVDLPSYKRVDLSIVFRMFTRGHLLQHQKLTGAFYVGNEWTFRE